MTLPHNQDLDCETLDQLFKALSHSTRRRVLLALHEENPQTPKELAARHPDREVPGTNAITLRHLHLPALAEAGFIEWDREGEKVKKGAQFAALRPHLDWLRGNTD